MNRVDLFHRLSGGDLRSIGFADEVAELAAATPAVFAYLVEGLSHEDARIRMRCADAIEKASARRPERLAPFGMTILELAEAATAKEIRWHMAQLLPRLVLNDGQRVRAVILLRRYMADPSRIVVANTLEALARLCEIDAHLRPEITARLHECAKYGSPAVSARARRLLANLQSDRESRPEPDRGRLKRPRRSTGPS